MPEIIFDTCVLSNFALAGAFPLLRTLYFRTALVADLVMIENMRGLQKGYAALAPVREALYAGWLKEVSCATPDEKRLFESLSISLGAGEAASIAIASHRGFIFACDDRAARKVAANCGVGLTGTVGILIKAVRVGKIDLSEANPTLHKMIRHGFYAPLKKITAEMVA